MGILGNLLVLVVIVTQAPMQTTTNMYILNMAIADILMCLGKKCFLWKHCTTDKQTETQRNKDTGTDIKKNRHTDEQYVQYV